MADAVRVASAGRGRPALRLVKTQDLSRDEWLTVRKGGIGSSDAAAAVGLNPYKSQIQLWMEKTGRDGLLPQVDPADDTSPLYWGSLLEAIVAAHYTRRTGHRVRRVNAVLQHPSYPWMLANLDREVVGAPDVQILECKTAGLNGARLWKDGVPEYVQLQVLHQLAVTGKQAADVAVLICGQEFQVHRIERDERMISQLMELEAAFWRHVEADLEPAADGSESADLALRSLYARDTGAVLDFTGDQELSAAFDQLIEVRKALALHAAQEQLLKQQIQQRMGEASKAVFLAGEVSWRRSKESTGIDLERLQSENPELVGRYIKPKPGSRRFLISD